MFQSMRGHRVARMLDQVRSAGIMVEDGDLIMLDGYVKGTVSGNDLLCHAYQFATLTSYQEWLFSNTGKRLVDVNSAASVEQIVVEVETFIRLKHSAACRDAAPTSIPTHPSAD